MIRLIFLALVLVGALLLGLLWTNPQHLSFGWGLIEYRGSLQVLDVMAREDRALSLR